MLGHAKPFRSALRTVLGCSNALNGKWYPNRKSRKFLQWVKTSRSEEDTSQFTALNAIRLEHREMFVANLDRGVLRRCKFRTPSANRCKYSL